MVLFLFRCGLALKCGRISMGYNAVADFSALNNPNGVWEYLATGAVMTAQRGYDVDTGWYTGSPIGSDAISGWYSGNISYPYDGSILQNSTSATIQFGGLSFRADHLHLDPQGVGNVAVRFTAPNSGIFDFAGDFIGDDGYQHAHPVEIKVMLSLSIRF
jgi:hypothetical protein